MTDFRGFYAATLTPFSADGSAVASDALGRLVEHDIAAGLDGLYVGGSTGEAFLMTPEERLHVFAATAEAARGRTRLIAHVGDLNPAVATHLAREAAKLGYDAVSAVPPFYYGYGWAEIRAFYAALATATDLPFLVYNIPSFSGVALSAGQLAELARLPNVAGIKFTSADLYGLERLRRQLPDRVLLNGYDELLLAGLSMGADGGIGSTYNVQGRRVMALARALAAGETARAQELQRDMNRLIDLLVEVGVMPGLKFLLSLWGLPMGPCRPPFLPLDAAAKARLEEAAQTMLDGEARPAEAAGH